MKQKTGQSAIDFMASVEIQARQAGIKGDQLRCAIVQGMLPNTIQEMCIHAAYPIDVKERVLPRSASQSPTARRVPRRLAQH